MKAAETAKSTVATTAVATATPVEKAEPKIKPVNARKYSLSQNPSIPPKGKQRLIVLSILNNAKSPMTPEEISPLAEKMGLTATGGVLPSVRYHLHHLVLLGIAKFE
jgi:hypothetical protein